MRHRQIYLLGLSLFLVVIGVACVTSTLAKSPPAVKNQAAVNTNSNVVPALQRAYRLLLQSSTNNGDHSALAAKDVREALTALGSNVAQAKSLANPRAKSSADTVKKSSRSGQQRTQTNSTATTSADATRKTAHSGQQFVAPRQATPEDQMRQAKQILQRALTQIGTSKTQATAFVSAAITEINAALSGR
jgi:hypothetical protein